MEIPEYVQGQIYVATNIKTWKQYTGQTRTHYKNRNNWIEAGYLKRWEAHLYEANKRFKKECAKLNCAIRKYGAEVFTVELLHVCPLSELDYWEKYYIAELETFTYGYNLTHGGKDAIPSSEMRMKISDTLIKNDERLDLLDDKEITSVKLSKIPSGDYNIASLLFRTSDNNNIKIDFGGKLRPFEESLARAIKFALYVVNENKIIVQACLKELVNLPNAQEDDKLIQNSIAQTKSEEQRLNTLRSLNIDQIRVECRKELSHFVAVLVIKTGRTKSAMHFGGKFIPFDTSLNNAVTLALKVVTKDKIILQQGLKHNLI